MNRSNVKAICLLSAAVLLSACSGSGADRLEQSMENMSYYRSTQSLSDNMISGETEGYAYCSSSDRIFFVSYFSGEDDYDVRSGYYLNSVCSDGSDLRSQHMIGKSVCVPDFSADGTGHYISSAYDEGVCRLVSIDPEGNELSSVKLDVGADDRDFFPRGVCVSDGGIYVNCYSSVYYFDPDGSLKAVLKDSDMNNWKMVKGASGAVYVWSYGKNGFELKRLDGTSDEIVNVSYGDTHNYDGNAYPIGGFGDTELFFSDGIAVFALDPDAGTREEIFNWFDCGVSIMDVSDVFPNSDGFVCGGSAYPSGKPSVYRVYSTAEKPAERKELVLAGDEFSIDSYIRNQAVNFNRKDDEYRLTMKIYPSDGNRQLNMDMLSGKAPDILMIGNDTPADSYISKGVFADMYDFIDADSEISRDDFLPGILKASESDGHLYTFSDRFKLFTVLGKTSFFGEEQGVTFDRLEETAAQLPEGAEIFPGASKSNILDYALYMSGDRFLDMKNGTCNFSSDYFVRLLEYANKYTDIVDEDSYFDDDSFWDRYYTMYADNSALMLVSYLADFSDIYVFEHEQFAEEATAVGFPADSGVGSAFEIETGFAISSSDNKEGAWRFVRTLLLPDYQDNVDSFSVRKDSMERKAAKAMEHDPKRTYNPISVLGDYWVTAGAGGDIGEPDKSDIDKVNAAIAATERIHKNNTTVNDIINEEASRYFAGTITSEQAAEAIQSRVSIYLSESY